MLGQNQLRRARSLRIGHSCGASDQEEGKEEVLDSVNQRMHIVRLHPMISASAPCCGAKRAPLDFFQDL